MRKTLLTLVALATLTAPLFSQQPSQLIPNLGLAKTELTRWLDSGGYKSECDEVGGRARAYLEQNCAGAKKPALVLDIDETSLSNLPEMREEDFGYKPKVFADWVHKGECPPIEGTLALYQWAQQHQVACFFITGRGEADRAVTEQNLTRAGYSDWAGLSLKPSDYHEKSIAPFKTGVRRQLSEQGYQILVNVGDQMSDLNGGYSESVYKLPNPMYFIP